MEQRMDPKLKPYFAPPTSEWKPKLIELRERDGLGQAEPGEDARALAEEYKPWAANQPDHDATREDQILRALEVRDQELASLRKAFKWLWIAAGAQLVAYIGLSALVLSYISRHP